MHKINANAYEIDLPIDLNIGKIFYLEDILPYWGAFKSPSLFVGLSINCTSIALVLANPSMMLLTPQIESIVDSHIMIALHGSTWR